MKQKTGSILILISVVLAIPMILSILTSFLRVDVKETFECWCRSDSGSGASGSQSLASFPQDYAIFVGPTSNTVITNTTNLPTLAVDANNSQYLKYVSSSSQYSAVKPVALTTSSGFSVTVRVMFTGTPGSWERILDFGSGTPNNNIVLARSGTTADLVGQIMGGGTGSPYVTAKNAIVQNTLMNIALVYDPSVGNGTMTLYLNGVAAGSATSFSQFAANRTVTNYWIGRSQWASDAYANMNLYRLAFYNRVLTNAEIASSATSIL